MASVEALSRSLRDLIWEKSQISLICALSPPASYKKGSLLTAEGRRHRGGIEHLPIPRQRAAKNQKS